MVNIELFEKIMTTKYFKNKLTNNIYLNNNYKKKYLFIKSNISIDEIEFELRFSLQKINWYSKYIAWDNPNLLIISFYFDIQIINFLMKNGFVILGRKCIFDTNNYKLLNSNELELNITNISKEEFIFSIFYDKYQIVFLNNFHIPKSSFSKLNKYELRVDTDFDFIVDKCSKLHGDDLLTDNIRNLYKKLYCESKPNFGFTSFALYRNNELKAGDFGCVVGNMYISYSGYYEESGAGTIQLIKMFQYLRESGFECCNLFGGGDYKYRLGAVDISLMDYLALFYQMKRKEKSIYEFNFNRQND